MKKSFTIHDLPKEERPRAVILSAEEFDSITETMEIMSDPEAMANIKKSEAEFKRGEYSDWEDVKKELE